jgi:hypothetical protein
MLRVRIGTFGGEVFLRGEGMLRWGGFERRREIAQR